MIAVTEVPRHPHRKLTVAQGICHLKHALNLHVVVNREKPGVKNRLENRKGEQNKQTYHSHRFQFIVHLGIIITQIMFRKTQIKAEKRRT